MDIYRLFSKQYIFNFHLFLVLSIDVPSRSIGYCEWFISILGNDGRHGASVFIFICVHLLFGHVIYEDKAEDARAIRHYGGFQAPD